MSILRHSLIIIYLAISLTVTGIAQTEVNCPGTQPSRLVVGEQARVIALDGINLRELPGVNNARINTALRGDLLQVLEGPFCSDSLAWWRVEYDGERAWTAEGLEDRYFLAPYILQHAQIGSLEITARPELVDSISTNPLEGRTEFMLNGYPVQEGFFPPIVRIFDALPDFDEVAAIETALQTTDPEALPSQVQARSKVQFMALPEGQSVRYTSLFLSPNAPDAAPVLLYSARGITRDGRYISLNIPIRTPNLPRPYQPQTATDNATYLEEYLDTHAEILNALPNESFTPNLTLLDEMLQSITTRAVPEPSEDAIPFVYFDSLRFTYTPTLARAATAEQVAGTETLPRHIRVFFTDYPVAEPQYEPALRIYSADFIASNRIIRLNLLLDQQPGDASSIPIPLRVNDSQALIAQLTYRDFLNGSGVRFLTAYPAETFTASDVVYSFQGVTEDNRFYISALFPLAIPSLPPNLEADALANWLEQQPDTAFQPPLSMLDALIASVEMRGVSD